jgi:hypothetical protein
MREQELKPCPFCNSEPYDARPDEMNIAWCKNSACEFSESIPVEQWNTRPIEDALRAEIAALKEAQLNTRTYFNVYDDVVWNKITHWRPLPAPPK